MQLSRGQLRRKYVSLEVLPCLLCQCRPFSRSPRCRGEKEATSPPLPPPPPLEGVPRSSGASPSEFTPKPLTRPIGLSSAPKAGENTGIDKRTLKQRREDFVNYDKHLAKRKMLADKLATPYFREWSNMRFHEGKSFLAPPRLFKSEKALYFPNLYGRTLLRRTKLGDTTPVLGGKLSIVSVFSSAWAEGQVATFVAEESNAELHKEVRESGGLAQLVHVNFEENALKAMLIRLFMPSLRRRMGADNWGRYFIVRKGFTDEIREAIGLLNSKVGYVYLLDEKCRIRWAGSGICEGDEKDGLVKGLRRLLEQARKRNAESLHAHTPRRVITAQNLREPSIEQVVATTV